MQKTLSKKALICGGRSQPGYAAWTLIKVPELMLAIRVVHHRIRA